MGFYFFLFKKNTDFISCATLWNKHLDFNGIVKLFILSFPMATSESLPPVIHSQDTRSTVQKGGIVDLEN
jgi:lipopolysaccharide export LptBFGC system permease protein LptF